PNMPTQPNIHTHQPGSTRYPSQEAGQARPIRVVPNPLRVCNSSCVVADGGGATMRHVTGGRRRGVQVGSRRHDCRRRLARRRVVVSLLSAAATRERRREDDEVARPTGGCRCCSSGRRRCRSAGDASRSSGRPVRQQEERSVGWIRWRDGVLDLALHGIGFRSVFLVSSCPYVFSNGYKVRFSEKPDQYCGIGYIVPEWVATKPFASDIRSVYGSENALPTTSIILPLKPEKVEALKGQLFQLQPELVLFLSKIKRICMRGNELGNKAPDNVSMVSVSSEQHHVVRREISAESYVVRLSVVERISDAAETCEYYMRRQTFPVKPENRVHSRMEAEKWTVSLAFPLRKRLTMGASSSECLLSCPHQWSQISHLQFILISFLPRPRKLYYWTTSGMLEFLNFIKELLKNSMVVPCSCDLHRKTLFCKPNEAIRILPKFQSLLVRLPLPLVRLDLFDKFILDSSLEHQRYRSVLEFLGIHSAGGSYDSYARCIKEWKLALLAFKDVYIDLLCFIADERKDAFRDVPVLKYINQDGKVEICSIAQASGKIYKVRYGEDHELHAWLNEINVEVGYPGCIFFLPDTIQQALVKHSRFHFLKQWLAKEARVMSYSGSDFPDHLCNFVETNKDPKLAIIVMLTWEKFMLRVVNSSTSSVSTVKLQIWMDFLLLILHYKWQEFYRNKIGLYGDELAFLGVTFGLPNIVKLILDRTRIRASSGMSKELACSLLLFVGYLRACITLDEQWLTAIRKGRWLRTSLGYRAPMEFVLLQAKEEVESILTMTNIPVIDEGYYGTKLTAFSPELELLGVITAALMNKNSGLLILKCIRYAGLAACEKALFIYRNIQNTKGSHGKLHRSQRSFVTELRAISVAVDLDSAVRRVASQLKFLGSSPFLMSNDAMKRLALASST
ncbi:hypothetical protein Tsubulata_044967, partial [Turnera subulata]